MDIVYKSRNFIVINKPVGIAAQPDPTGDADAMTLSAEELKARSEPSLLWLVHRLDRTVGGLMVFARNQKSAAALSSLIQECKFKKEYLAALDGECAPDGEMRDYVYKDAKISKAFVVNSKRAGVKEAVLTYKTLATANTEKGTKSLVSVLLKTGRYHQIRVQFASRKMPLIGDGKYGSTDNGRRTPALFSHRIAFTVNGETVDVRLSPDKNEYPWNLWSDML